MPAPKLPSVKQWRSYFSSRGLDQETTELYLSYIRPLCKHNIPVIFDREHLSRLLGRTSLFVASATSASHHYYRFFEIPKRKGGKRSISAPYPSLLECQRWIADEILARLPVHPCATGYIVGRSIKDHAQPHLGREQILTVDLKDFFPSITLRRIIGFFRDLGYTHEVAVTLGKLSSLDGVLPQGAPTSPSLSNLICRRLDASLARLASAYRLTYTRYADDMCFSGRHIPTSFFYELDQHVQAAGFRINSDKTRKYNAGSTSKVITGLNAATNELRLPKAYKRSVSLALYHIEKHGFYSHIAKLKITNPGYISALLGKVGYWLFIEPENKKALRYLNILQGLQQEIS